jgi:hypothetical protein
MAGNKNSFAFKKIAEHRCILWLSSCKSGVKALGGNRNSADCLPLHGGDLTMLPNLAASSSTGGLSNAGLRRVNSIEVGYGCLDQRKKNSRDAISKYSAANVWPGSVSSAAAHDAFIKMTAFARAFEKKSQPRV